jgi:O-antigen biosynthesis protein
MSETETNLLAESHFRPTRPISATSAAPDFQYYIGGPWSMHLPFAWDLIREVRPRLFVELGVYMGESYFTFCQSVQENQLPTLCYGVDTWQGDPHTGFYETEVGRGVEANNTRYSGFSQLLTMNFNEALSRFVNGSIDLLHIDGAHRYDEVKEDFENWLPKLSDDGIILFHDIMERQRDFGVWRLWQAIARPRASFAFEFGHGLGVWKKKEASEADPRFVRKLFLADGAEQREIANHYAIAAAAADLKAKIRTTGLNTTSLQVFARRDNIPAEHDTTGCDFEVGKWQYLSVELPYGTGDGSTPLRFDPGSEAGVIEIKSVVLRSAATKKILWRAEKSHELSSLAVGGTASVVPQKGVFRILNLGNDPQILLPDLNETWANSPLTFEIWLRLDTSAQTLSACFSTVQANLEKRIALSVQEPLTSEKRSFEQQRATLEKQLRETKEDSQAKQEKVSTLRSQLEWLDREVWNNKVRRADAIARLRDREQWISQLEKSFAWKLAKPLFKLQRHFSRRSKNATSKSDELVCALDGPGSWNASTGLLTLVGSCYARTGSQVVGIRTKIGGKSYFARYGLRRDDIGARQRDRPAALHSGFILEAPVPRDLASLQLEAIVQEGSWQTVLQHSLVAVTIAPSKPPEEKKKARPSATSINVDFQHQNPLLFFRELRAKEVPLVLEPLTQQLQAKKAEETLFSVITPAFDTKPRWLAEAAASLLNQTIPDWEWFIVDDGSQSRDTRETLKLLSAMLPNLRVIFGKRAGISAATNQALDLATGEFVCFLDHDDLLEPNALELIAKKLRQGFDTVYSDQDKLNDETGQLVEPFYKPEWSPEYFRGAMYIGHLLCIRRELAQSVRFRSEFDGVQDFEFMLRVSETGASIGHVSQILYHWRKVPGSVAYSYEAKPKASLLQETAVNAHLQRIGLPARAERGSFQHRLEIVPARRNNLGRVSIIIPTKDAPELLSACLKSIFDKTTYGSYEVILVDNETINPEALKVMQRYPVIRVDLPNPFNFSRANNIGVRHATGEFVVFLNNDTEVLSAQWLDHLLYYARQIDVGAVGALLLYENDTVQHGGVVLGMRGTADHSMRGFTMDSDGYAGSLCCAREVSGVTAACMAMRKSLLLDLNGFNEHFFTSYQDVDLCLRLRARGLRIVWTPRVILRHYESVSRQKSYDMVDRYLLLDQWEEVIKEGDPYYNSGLNLERGDYSVN